MVEGQPVVEQALAHLRAADLHADFGQHAFGLVDYPGGELRAQDVQARTHPRSFKPTSRWSGMEIPMPFTLRLMRRAVPSCASRARSARIDGKG
jgi:hypothetical protein